MITDRSLACCDTRCSGCNGAGIGCTAVGSRRSVPYGTWLWPQTHGEKHKRSDFVAVGEIIQAHHSVQRMSLCCSGTHTGCLRDCERDELRAGPHAGGTGSAQFGIPRATAVHLAHTYRQRAIVLGEPAELIESMTANGAPVKGLYEPDRLASRKQSAVD